MGSIRRLGRSQKLGFAHIAGEVFAGELILDAEEYLGAGVRHEHLPIVLVEGLELRQRLDRHKEFHPEPGDLCGSIFDDLQPSQPCKFIKTKQHWITSSWPSWHALHFGDGERGHHAQPTMVGAHVTLRQ